MKPELKSVVLLDASTGRHVERCRWEMQEVNDRESGRVRELEVELKPREDTDSALIKGDIAGYVSIT